MVKISSRVAGTGLAILGAGGLLIGFVGIDPVGLFFWSVTGDGGGGEALLARALYFPIIAAGVACVRRGKWLLVADAKL